MIPARAPLNGFSPGRPGLSPSSAPAPASHAPPASPRTKIRYGAAFSVVFAENAARTRECSRSRRRSRSAPCPSRLTCRWLPRSLAAKPPAGGLRARGWGRPGYLPFAVNAPVSRADRPPPRPAAPPPPAPRRVRPGIPAGGTTARGWAQAGGPCALGRRGSAPTGSHPPRKSHRSQLGAPWSAHRPALTPLKSPQPSGFERAPPRPPPPPLPNSPPPPHTLSCTGHVIANSSQFPLDWRRPGELQKGRVKSLMADPLGRLGEICRGLGPARWNGVGGGHAT